MGTRLSRPRVLLQAVSKSSEKGRWLWDEGKRRATRHECVTHGVDEQRGYPKIRMVAIEGCAITREGTVTKMRDEERRDEG